MVRTYSGTSLINNVEKHNRDKPREDDTSSSLGETVGFRSQAGFAIGLSHTQAKFLGIQLITALYEYAQNERDFSVLTWATVWTCRVTRCINENQ